MERVIELLKHELKSEVRYDTVSKRLYSTDASIYEVEPLAVLIPRTKGELVRAIEICSENGVAVIPRGAATGITGGCLGRGLVIDTSQHLNRIVEVDFAKRYAVVQPGVVPDRLNERLAPHGLYFAPEISTSNRATIGGMVAANSAGANSLKVGSTQDHVLEVELILATGEALRFSSVDRETWRQKLTLKGTEGKIYRQLEHIRNEYAEDIQRDFPKTPRRVSGYSLNALKEGGPINVAALICGSEGTLGFISEIKVALSPIPAPTTLVVIGYKDLDCALSSSYTWLDLKPSAVEMIDSKIITAGRSSPSLRGKLSWLDGEPDALIMWELDDPAKVQSLCLRAASHPQVLFAKEIGDPQAVKNVWDLRKSGLGMLLSKRAYSRAIAFIEDVAIPPQEVAPFVAKLNTLLKSSGKDAGIYGHIGAGCLHVRPYIDLRRPEELAVMQHVADSVLDLLLEHGGVYSGEHGDGRVRSWTNPKMFGARLYEAFTLLKKAFDPYGIMNPGKIVASPREKPQGLLENLRLSPSTPIKEFSTYLDFSKEGGFSLAVDLCNGNGQCRKKEGVMCPSYQASCDERDSTRARADALRGVIHGHIPEKELYGEDFHKVMDLCIQCKGCKTECPSQVDMAKMKSEYLYHYHKKKSPTLRDRLFAHITAIFSWASKASRFVNFINSISFLPRLLGIAADRKLPTLAQKRFSSQVTPKDNALPKVVLFADSFTEFLSPEIGLSAIEVLEALGYNVIVPPWQCCGRPYISKGFLPDAKLKLATLLDSLYPYAKEGLSIVGLEPSCMSALSDDIGSFGLDPDKVELLKKAIKPLDQFLYSHKEQLKKLVKRYEGKVLLHGHCHQKALYGTKCELALLQETCAQDASEIPSGCCGMAGAFGYEEEHSAFSKKIGELVLFPSLRKMAPDTIVIADGNSCRCQIDDGVGIKAIHFIEFLAKQLKEPTVERG